MSSLIKKIVGEALAYDTIDQMESYIEKSEGLSNLPIQPLYLALRKSSLDKVVMALEKMSKEQRELVLDLEIWHKDRIDVSNFENWPLVYAQSPNEKLRLEFAKSNQFLFFLKSKFNIWTFDVEDPLYPDHDNYFLTDDGLLLFEFDENALNIDEIKLLIRELYSDLGVEEAYSFLFKIISEDYLQLEEEEYQNSKSRLRDFGLVDYYDSLEIQNCFPSFSHLENFIKLKKALTGEIDTVGKSQALHNNSVMAFKEGLDDIDKAFDNIQDKKRIDYLHFNFLRLVNGTISFDDAMRGGIVSLTRTGKKTKSLVLLGFDYLGHFIKKENLFQDQEIFNLFDFQDLYKIGNTLVKLNQKKLKLDLVYFLENKEAEKFLGNLWGDFLNNALEVPPILKIHKVSDAVEDYKTYNEYLDYNQALGGLAPFIKEFHKTFSSLVKEGKLQDYFYLNYNVEDIDFESIFLTNFSNFILKTSDKSSESKMGITKEELRVFCERYFGPEGKLTKVESLKEDLLLFLVEYGMNFSEEKIISYMVELIKSELEDYDFSTLIESEYKYIGGPIILA